MHIEVPGLSARLDVSPPDPDNPRTYPGDAYPAVIMDQRHGYSCETADEVLAHQLAWLHGESPPLPFPRPPIEPVADERAVVPYINASRWVADCPECGASNWVWDRNPSMVCLGDQCGHVCKVLWQLPAARAAVIRVIAGWPQGNRCWDAHKGETVEELTIQGVLMLGAPPEERNGLLVAASVPMPDELVSPQEYLDRLRTLRIKARV